MSLPYPWQGRLRKKKDEIHVLSGYLILAKAVAMRVMINATGCPAPVSDRNRTHTHKHLSQLIELAIDHDIPTPV